MKFADSRITLIKVPYPKNVFYEATPRMLSAFEGGYKGQKPRHGVKLPDVFMPTSNRAQRRANSQVAPRKRLVLEPHWLKTLKEYRKLQRMHASAQVASGS